MDKKAIKTSGKILLSFCKGSTSMNLANVFVKSFFRFSDFLLEKGRIKLNPQQLWIFEKAI